MKPQEVTNLVEKVQSVHVSIIELNKAWNMESDVLDNYYPFGKCFNELTFQVGVWAENVTKNLHTEVTMRDKFYDLIHSVLGKENVSGGADWCGDVTVWVLSTIECHDCTKRQCLIIDENDQVVLTIREDYLEGDTIYNDISFIDDEMRLTGLLQILTRDAE